MVTLRGVSKGAQAPSLNILMVEIGKILGEIGDKSGKICKNWGKRILSTHLNNIPGTPLCTLLEKNHLILLVKYLIS